ncbi:hypothetical protein BDM02DRAFT_3093343 [Thelephora ganbajun]|uniref:Uncharacterized protein n=1 Tax=Thelephora ganbajun TaxID=370292 RepID=A0ACB6ZLV6_THEGA|nr:hypothetical protein BDM02DRAFT_3093343 [Thelephora ganbajun]
MNAQERLHFGFLGEPFLLTNLRIDSFESFIAGALFITAICFSERILTLAISRRWSPLPILRSTQLRVSMWRTALYWVVTFQRMLYMLAAMSLNVWILIVIVTSLAAGQFVIELNENPGTMMNHPDVNGVKEPLLATSADGYELNSVTTRPRSKSKPDGIFIHPKHSNIARAEVIAVHMGFGTENNEYVDASSYVHPRRVWGVGNGRDVARGLLGGSSLDTNAGL